ncbi:probable cytochrome P450 6a17 isoform X2 [Photinus pyralis]|uniref:probable cytochrome P450 6a17 isoform X2 n=1 Tax=Photinus pyralis TaxID=7054 RepID=UPI0012670889|nr:probable cytochrome P450 6a17 isoform X2 [Photinus pyralis]
MVCMQKVIVQCIKFTTQMDALLGIISAALAFITLIVFWVNSYHTYWAKRGVETLRTTPLIGNTQNIWRLKEPMVINFKRTYDHFKAKGKKYAGYYFFMRPVFVPIDLDLIKTIGIHDFNHFTDHIGCLDEKGDPLSTHLFNQKGDRWKFLRPKVSATFTSGKLKGMFDGMLRYSEQLADLICKMADRTKAIDIEHISLLYTSDIIIYNIFGVKSRMIMGEEFEFERCLKKLHGADFRNALHKLLLLTCPDLYAALKMRTFDKRMTNFFMNFVKQRLEQRSKSNVKKKDFVQLLLECGSTSNGESERTDTISRAISLTLFELSVNQDIQEKARDEIKSVRNKFNGEFCYEGVLEMKYLANCITESLRKHPPVALTTRVCTKKYKVPDTDVTIEKGTYVWIPIHAMHMDPEYFPSPEIYDPDRFTDGTKTNPNPFAFMPFGFGPRMCIGSKFAMLEVSIVLSLLLSRFRFSVHPDTKIPLKYEAWALSRHPSPPIKLLAERIDKS